MLRIDIDSNLNLRLLLYNEVDMFFKSLEKNREYIQKFMPRINENKSVEDTKIVVGTFIKQLLDNNGFRLGIFLNEEFIGIIGLKYIDWINKKTEVMYWVDKDYSGSGIATKCLKKILDISFNYYKLNKVILIASENNISSKIVAKKCGFILEGTLRSDELLDYEYTNSLQFGILKSDFDNLK